MNVLTRFYNSDLKPSGTFDIPSNIDTVGNGMYIGCTKLRTLIVPNNVIKIGLWGFSGCRNLRTLTLPTSLIYISNNAFTNCESLEVIIIDSKKPEEIERIKALLPKDLQNKALGIELAHEVFRLRKLQLDEVTKVPSSNPFFRFFDRNLRHIAKVNTENDANPSLEKKEYPKLKDKVYKDINRFLLNKNPNYQKAKVLIRHEPLPHNQSELEPYAINLKKITTNCNTRVNQKKMKTTTCFEHEPDTQHILR